MNILKYIIKKFTHKDGTNTKVRMGETIIVKKTKVKEDR
jgi:hypothetical protein